MDLAFRIKRLRILDDYYNDFLKTSEKMPAGRLGMRARTLASTVIWGTSFSEYYGYRFWKMKLKEKKNYMTRRGMVRFFDRYNPEQYRMRIGDKSVAPQYYGAFLNREQFSASEGYAAFESFCKKYPRVFIKNTVGWGGEGSRIEDVSTEAQRKNVWQTLSDHVAVEPVITNCAEIRAFSPASLNTVKVTALIVKGKPVIQYAMFRIGNGTIVDNVHLGGIGCGVNIETGIVETEAVDKHFCRYSVHPVSRKQIVGFQLPFWKETIELVKSAAAITPELRYASWDVAITENGPILMEGNWDAEFYPEQMIYGIGSKTLFEKQLENR